MGTSRIETRLRSIWFSKLDRNSRIAAYQAYENENDAAGASTRDRGWVGFGWTIRLLSSVPHKYTKPKVVSMSLATAPLELAMNRLRDQAAIVGIGQTPFSKGL